jgi:hypothetical protein
MHNLLFRYTRHSNQRYRKAEYLFQSRHKAIRCEKESYVLELVRYIHLNPVRSRLVRDPSRYAWSSHEAYVRRNGSGWIAVAEVLPRVGADGHLPEPGPDHNGRQPGGRGPPRAGAGDAASDRRHKLVYRL